IPVVLEVNTIPGLTEMSLLPKAALAAGVDFEGLILKILKSVQ
ncbi:MAG: D-alanine--D-alanine ligase, partial [Candidatus Omnitrophica bacterium]|nr:D-alanine--D-alanine ligase [Candidatus Omnitrophota bacterium]